MAAGRIRGITIEIGGDTTKLESALKSVDSNIRKTQSSLRDVNKLLKLDPSNTELLTQKQKLLGTQIDDTKGRLQTLKDTAANVTPDDIGQEKYDALQREIIDTENQLKSLESQSASAASVLGSQMQVAGEKIKDVGSNVTEVGKNLTEKLTVPLVAAGGVAVAKFAEVDKTMQLTNATMGNTEEQADKLSQAMKDAASNSTFGMSDAATATLNFARAGLTAEEAAAALAPAMNLAAGEGGNLDTVSAGLVATINGFGGSFDEATNYADVFANACNNSALDIDSLSSAMSTAAPVFSAAGYSVNDAALYMGVMANAGIGAEEAATSLKTGLSRLVDPSKEAAAKMEELGISVTNADGTMKDSKTVQKELHDAFGKLSDSEKLAAASTIFGKNQMDKWLALIETSPSEVDELSSSLETQGTTSQMATAMMSGFGGSLEKLKSSADVLMTSLGEALAPTIEKVAAFLQNLVDKFNSLTPAQQQTIAQIGLFLAALGPVIMIVGGIISVIGTVVGAIGTVITAITAVSGVMAAGGGAAAALSAAVAALGGPVTVITGVIVGLIAVGALLIANWGKIKETAGNLAKGVSEKWNSFKENTAETFNNAKEKIKSTLSEAKEKAVQKATELKDKAVEKWENLKSKTSEVYTNVKDKIGTTITEAKEKAVKTATDLKDKAVEKWENFKQKTADTWTNAKEKISTTISDARNTAVEKAENLRSNVSKKWEDLKSAANDKWSSIKNHVSEKMSAAASSGSSSANSLQEKASSAFKTAASATGTQFTKIRDSIKTALSTAKQVSGALVDGMLGKFKSGFTAAQGAISGIFEGIKSKISSAMSSAKTAVSKAVESIKSKMKFKWSLPKLKMPHISISGKFSINPPSAPHFSISWHKTAMENGLIFTNPTIFGMANGRLQGAGDAGAEALVGVSSLQRMVRDAVASVGTNDPDVIYAAVKAGMENANVGVYVGEREFGRMLKGQGVVMV